MTSAINPNNIDGTYPIAGQDNNSQGFRDNFTNTKTNFEYAAEEITELQNKGIFKTALTGTILDNNMNGSILSNAQLQDMSETLVNLGTLSGTVTVNYAAGSYQTVATNGAIILTFSNFPAAGAAGTVVVQINVTNAAHTLTLPAAVNTTKLGIQGLSGTVITFASSGLYSFVFTTSDGGSSISITDTNKRLQPFNNSTEDLATATAASLAFTTSYFTTTGAETATLAAGVAGQIKTFAMFATAGNMVITVTNAGWKTSGTGTMTFTAIGQACTLQYINNKWFCSGNNGVTFA
jgi:hypothetical protein